LTIDVPLTATSACAAAPLWGGATHELVGVECLWEPPGATAAQRVMRELDLSGMDTRSSLELMMTHSPEYEARVLDGITVFRPRATENSMLDVVVPHFAVSNASLVDAAEAVNRIFDPSYRVTGAELAGPRNPASIVATSERARRLIEAATIKYNERFTKSITLEMTGATVEDILSALARAAPTILARHVRALDTPIPGQRNRVPYVLGTHSDRTRTG
jgi:hypothetical protein